MNPIYLDHASTTPVDKRVVKAMQPYFDKIYANPSSIHDPGQKARAAVERARATIAKLLHVTPKEIIFTSGGTESNNLALQGFALAKGKGHIITSQIEHPSVLETCKHLEKNGFAVTYLPPDKWGLISAQKVEKAIRKDTILISVMYANNEIGTIQPIAEIGRIASTRNIPFHTDACQAGSLNLNVNSLNVDLMTLNGSKIYGPKGVGILYRRKNVPLLPLHYGGGQEFGLRSGTENVSGIVGLVMALQLIQHGQENRKLTSLRDYFIRKAMKTIPDVTLNGHARQRLPNNLNLSFAGVEAEAVLRYLNQKKIYVSTGSACSAQEITVSHVLNAIGAKEARGSIRFTLGRGTTKKELDLVIKVLREIIADLRKAYHA